MIEDSRNGLLAAVGAGLRCVVTVSSYTDDEDLARPRWSSRASAIRAIPTRVLANRGAVPIGDRVTLADLDACRTQPISHKETV